ncbi:tryptophan 2,3-dioxygenase [bacterium SCSIO 12741]|nr:tryptophan 2,3-dioxygenase [bacterium SCSIO 12741]
MTPSDWIQKLEEKYESQGQSLDTYLEGLYHAKPITYWDYIEVDTLLSLQKPRTDMPDEMIFILYHQVTELLLKLVNHEIKQVTHSEDLTGAFMFEKMKRANRYVQIAVQSFDVMREGMDPEQYNKYRMTLTPASGFQSAQFRLCEIFCTDLWNLVINPRKKDLVGEKDIEKLFKYIYWQEAGIDRATGEKSLTLRLFEEKYLDEFNQAAEYYQTRNVWQRYLALPEAEKTAELQDLLKKFDRTFNVYWPKVHLRTAEKYLEHNQEEVKEATGGSDWKKYLHPKFQRRIFFPGLLSAEELENWGED